MHRSAKLLLLLIITMLFIPASGFSAQPGERRMTRRDNERVTVEGRVRELRHERNGYRVQLDRGNDWFWVPDVAVRMRPRDFRVGASIRFGGFFRGGTIYVDVVDWLPIVPRDVPRNRYDVVRGEVIRVDFGRDLLILREERTGRMIRADLRHLEEPISYHQLERGDVVRITGAWSRNGEFDVLRIQHSRGRY